MAREMKHSLPKHKKFFALTKELGWDKDKAMEKARKRYNVFHFSDITDEQLGDLIRIMTGELTKKQYSVDFKIKCRVWDHNQQRMLYEDDFIERAYWQIDFEGANFLLSPKSVDATTRLDTMLFSGKKDHFEKELYQMDIFVDRNQKRWLVDWSEKDLAWIGACFDDKQETKFLSGFGAIKKIGDVYQGVEEAYDH